MTPNADAAATPTIEDAARCYDAGDYAGAERCARAVVAADPHHFDALHLLGVLSLNGNRLADAAAWLRRAAAGRPEDPQVHYHLGNALLGLRLFDVAEAAFRETLRLAPGHADALNNLGNALADAGRHRQAADCFRQALTLRPNAAASLFNLGRALAALGQPEQAAARFRAALDYGGDAPPDRLADVVAALCQTFIDQERYDAALAACRDVPPQVFGHPVIEWNESLTRLMLGDYRNGWRLYESRFLVPEHDPPRPGAAVLDLATVAGKRVLVFAEQGRGDAIQFARYLTLLAQRGAQVIAEVYPELQPLFAGIEGVTQVVAPDDPVPPHDLLTPLLSLPLAFGTEVSSIPAEPPYVSPPQDRREAWTARLAARSRPRVGLAWWGAQHIPKRSIPAHLLTPLLERPDLEFHAVQKDVTPTDADWLARHPAVRTHAAALRDFADTAALLAQMDLVISIDTAVAHLAGALGRPVWILLPFSPDWRWFAARTDSPWYPTARLFRQKQAGDWAEVIQRVAGELAVLPLQASSLPLLEGITGQGRDAPTATVVACPTLPARLPQGEGEPCADRPFPPLANKDSPA